MDRTQLKNNIPDNNSGAITALNVRDIVDGAVLPEDLIAGANIIIDKSALPAITITGDAAPQLQSDWTQTDITSLDYIKNKPTGIGISGYSGATGAAGVSGYSGAIGTSGISG